MLSAFRKKLISFTPPEWHYRLAKAKNAFWGGWKHHYYSHFGEDAFIHSYFRHQKKGFYVDVGAHHPRRYSNTALLYERGWNGVNIEPDERLIRTFNKYRKRDVNLCLAVGAKEGEFDFYRYSDPAINTLSRDEVTRLKGKDWAHETSVSKVPVRTLKSLLDENIPENTTIDFLNVDVEGLDLEVLSSNDWDTYRPRVVAVEDLNFDLTSPRASDTFVYMSNNGYVFLGYIGLTLIFLDKKEVKK